MENENKLPEEFKEMWVKALRSGKYKQCTMRQMSFAGTYCCIAVACKILGLPDELLEGDRLELPKVIRGGFTNPISCRLIRMNDGHDYGRLKDGEEPTRQHSFLEIADYIEQNL